LIKFALHFAFLDAIISFVSRKLQEIISIDEISNVNLFTTISHMYFKIPKNRTYFV